jgi:hypothetical protein
MARFWIVQRRWVVIANDFDHKQVLIDLCPGVKSSSQWKPSFLRWLVISTGVSFLEGGGLMKDAEAEDNDALGDK